MYPESAHTASIVHAVAGTPPTYGEPPNRPLTAFEVAEFVGCHEETVRRAYLLGLLVWPVRHQEPAVSPTRRARTACARSAKSSLNLGLMFWLWWKTLSGSYVVFTSTSRS